MTMTIANVEMAAAWDGDEGDDWTDHADRYDLSTSRPAAAFWATAPVRRQDDVLDIGCGTGLGTIRAAGASESGRVVGIDLSSRMLELARRRADEAAVDATF